MFNTEGGSDKERPLIGGLCGSGDFYLHRRLREREKREKEVEKKKEVISRYYCGRRDVVSVIWVGTILGRRLTPWPLLGKGPRVIEVLVIFI